jgi:hypothetical protein
VVIAMSMRQRLPNRRRNETRVFEHAGMQFVLTVGFYSNNTVGEIFLNNGKFSSMSDALVRDGAVLVSLAIQHGTPLEVLRGAILRDPRGNPATPIGRALDLLAEGDNA